MTDSDPCEAGGEGSRHEARERALALVYESELKATAPGDVLASLAVAPDPFAERLVRGLTENLERVDSLVAAAALSWELDRMPVLDRWILRLATYELLHEEQVPVAVVIDEAVELAKQYSTEDSGRFVNGVLSSIAREVRT